MRPRPHEGSPLPVRSFFWDKESDLEDTVEVPRDIQKVLVKAAQGEGPLKDMLSPPVLPLTIDPVSMKPDSLPLSAAWRDETDPEWIRIRTVMDSGAAENVGPPTMAPMAPTLDSPGSLRGQAYIAAEQERIPNVGQQTLNVVTNEGYETQTVYQIAEVTRPLTAVGTTCVKGNFVVFGPHGGCGDPD